MIAVVLLQLLEVFLTFLASVVPLTIESIDDPDPETRRNKVEAQFKKIVTQFADRFQERHFTKTWQVKSLNHKDGRALLFDYFDKINKGTGVHRHPLISLS